MIYIDVSDLPAPEPLEKVLELLAKTNSDEIICMTHRHNPCSLFTILKDRGYSHLVNEKGNLVNIYIWHAENKIAAGIVKKEIENVR